MPDQTIYVIDSSVFIEAARRYYAFDIAPTFWNGLVSFASNRQIMSIDRVSKELVRGKDALVKWAETHFSTWFVTTNEAPILQEYGHIIQWAEKQSQFSRAAKDEFADDKNADAWVISFALAKGLVVVTQEALRPEIKSRIPIPNVCKAFNIPYIDTFDMLRKLNFKF